jgi:hypothetical protein
MPDSGLVAIHPVEDEDDLVNELIERDPAFRALLAKSAASPRKPFQPTIAPEETR